MPRRRRWPALAALFLTLGLLTTIAVAWSLAAWLPHTNLWSAFDYEGPLSDHRIAGIATWECGRTGMLRRAWQVEVWGASYGPLGEVTGRSAPETYTPKSGPLWGTAIPLDPWQPPSRYYGNQDARGWPMLAFWCEYEDLWLGGTQEWRASGGVPLSD